jgi:aminopeptidase-like protein
MTDSEHEAIRFEFPRSFDLAEHSPIEPPDDETRSMLELIERLYMNNRSLVTDGYDDALDHLCTLADFDVLKFPTGYKAFTWTVPEKWVVREARITKDGETVCDFADHPLYLMSYSEPFSGTVNLDELKKHLHTNPDRREAIPYAYSYYHRDWGMTLPFSRYQGLTEGDYDVHIDTSFEPGELKIGELVLPGESDRSIIISAHLDHPGQIADGLGAVAIGIALFKRLAQMKSRRYTYRLVILPENIGSACYLHHFRDQLDQYEYAIFLEMLTNKGRMSIQQSKRGNTRLDRLAELAVQEHEPAYGVGPFRQVICNDEINFDGPGIDIPTVTLTRWPYPEYHTSDDGLGAVSAGYLKRSLDVCWSLVSKLESNVVPVPLYSGNLMLGRYGLYEDLNADDTVEQMMLAFDGLSSILEIAERLDIPFVQVANYADRFAEKGLVTMQKLPPQG